MDYSVSATEFEQVFSTEVITVFFIPTSVFPQFQQLILSRHQTARKKLHKKLDSISHHKLYSEK